MGCKLVATWLLLMVLAARAVHGQLRCYVCENCPDPFDGSLHSQPSCPLDPDTPTTTVSPPLGDTTILTPPTWPSLDPTGSQTTAPTQPPSETPPVPQTPIITPPPFPGRRKRQVPNGYRCYRIEYAGTVRRGCASFLNSDAETCQSINGGAVPNSCRVCDSDGCNSAVNLRVSLVALLPVTLLAVLLKY